MNISKNIKNIFDDENKIRILGLLTLLTIIWFVLYFIPSVFTSLFNSLLGNIILLLSALLVTTYDVRLGIVTSLVLIVLYRFSRLSAKEGFVWSKDSTNDFLLLQNTENRNTIFDVDLIQKSQASQEELDYFMKNGMWPWSERTIQLYRDAVLSNPFIRTYSGGAVKYARRIYNEAAILRVMSYQTKEGQFLINGVLVADPSGNPQEEMPNGFGDFPYTSGLKEDRTLDVIKCNMSKPNGASLERTRYTGRGGIYGEQMSTVTPVDYNNLETDIPGFTFLSTPCNPCGAINETPDYSCPFKLNVKNKSPFISSVWQYLWNINDNPLQSIPSFLSESINPKDFPILSELQSELKKKDRPAE
jgi:hypothetical protein